ncbi:MAG: chemotaxis response regulator protein-glutamate methylesterase [Thermoguttaceae bacterium]
MSREKIRVLVVDDSAVIRQQICDFVEATDDMEVAATAKDGHHAIEAFATTQPDVVTLDVQMPDMDGLAALDAILAKRPVPVIMVSGLTQLGASVTFEALERGAMDYIAKPERGAEVESVLGDDLLRKIRSFAGADVNRILQIRKERAKRTRRKPFGRPPAPKEQIVAAEAAMADLCIVIGISTGGPPALASLFETLRPSMPPIVVVQHMPPHFTRPLSWRLDALSQLSIKEAETGDVLQPNHVLIAPGGTHLELRRLGEQTKVVLRNGPPVSGHKPSVDVMMTTAAAIYGPRLLGVIMTGMGHDGAEGCRTIRAAGGYVLGQDEASSDVYGMNKVAFVEGNVDRQFHLDDAGAVIRHQIRRLSRTASPSSPAPSGVR